jgi:hypothetical protein
MGNGYKLFFCNQDLENKQDLQYRWKRIIVGTVNEILIKHTHIGKPLEDDVGRYHFEKKWLP